MEVSVSLILEENRLFLLIINLYVIIYQLALAEQIDQYKACVSKQLDVIYNNFCMKILSLNQELT